MSRSEKNCGRKDDCSSLSVKHQELLSLYFDGESSWLQSINAKRLLKFYPAAVDYVTALSELRTDVNQVLVPSSSSIPKVDLWARIENRIENEERNAVFSRNASSKKVSKETWLAKFWGGFVGDATQGRGVGIGFGAGVVSAALLMFAVVPSSGPGINRPVEVSNYNLNADRHEVQVAQAVGGINSEAQEIRYSLADIQGTDFDVNGSAQRSFGVGSNGYRSISSSREVQPVEIDWVRSDGRLRVMRDAHESNPVIFVAPRSRSIGVISGGVNSGIRDRTLSRRPAKSTLAPFDDTFGVASVAKSSDAASDAMGR